MSGVTLGPNAVLPCGTESRRRTHRAHGELCAVCDPEVEWTARCPVCRLDVPARGTFLLPHSVGGPWLVEASRQCPGGTSRVQPPALPERVAWRRRGVA